MTKVKRTKATILLPDNQEITYYGNVSLFKALKKSAELYEQGLRRLKIQILNSMAVSE